jgi:hypothetical protein
MEFIHFQSPIFHFPLKTIRKTLNHVLKLCTFYYQLLQTHGSTTRKILENCSRLNLQNTVRTRLRVVVDINITCDSLSLFHNVFKLHSDTSTGSRVQSCIQGIPNLLPRPFSIPADDAQEQAPALFSEI